MHRNMGSKETGWRLPSREIEYAIATTVREWLSDLRRVAAAMGADLRSARDTMKLKERIDAMIASPASLDEANRGLLFHVKRTRFISSGLEIVLDGHGLAKTLEIQVRDIEFEITVVAPASMKRRGIETKLILTDVSAQQDSPDTKLIDLVARAHTWFDDLSVGKIRSLDEIVKHERIDDSDVSRTMPLAFLAPDLIELILDGSRKLDVASEHLLRTYKFSPQWNSQRRDLAS